MDSWLLYRLSHPGAVPLSVLTNGCNRKMAAIDMPAERCRSRSASGLVRNPGLGWGSTCGVLPAAYRAAHLAAWPSIEKANAVSTGKPSGSPR